MKKPCRILLFVYEYPPLGGGVANAIYHLLDEFTKEKKLQIDLITASLENNWSVTRFCENIACYRVPVGEKSTDSYQRQTAANMLVYTKNSLKQALDLVDKNKYDLVHIFGYPSALQAWILKQKFKLPYVVSLRGVDVPGYNPRFKLIDFSYRWFIKILWKNAQALIVNSQKLLDLAKETYSQGDFKIIPNGVNTSLFKPNDKKFKNFTITAGGTIFGKKKGLEYLIAAFAKFAKDKEGVELLLIGDGDLAIELKNLVKRLKIEEKVKFVGREKQDWMASNLPQCEVFCLPSLNEGMSNATLRGNGLWIAFNYYSCWRER